MKKLNSKWSFRFFWVALMVAVSIVSAPFAQNAFAEGEEAPAESVQTVTIHLRVESDTSTIVDQDISVPETCEVADASGATSSYSGFKGICILQAAQDAGLFTYEINDFSFGLFLNAINGIGGGDSMFWALYTNNTASFVGLSDLTLVNQDEILLAYVNWNFSNELLSLVSNTSSVKSGTGVNFTAQEYINGVETNYENEVTFFIDGTSFVSPSGTLEYVPQTEGSHEIYVEASGKTRSEKIYLEVLPAVEPELQTEETQVHLDIRFEDNLFFSDTVTIPYSTSTLDSNGISHALETENVLKALLSADEVSDTFAITNLQYYKDLSSFYLNCITLEETSTSSQKCNGWQYTVNGLYSYVSMDSYELNGNEHVYIYFGERYTLTTKKTEYSTTETITSTLQEYRFDDNTWIPATNQEILLTEPIAADYSNLPPHIFASSTTNELGEVYFNQTSTGTYYITLPHDYLLGVTIMITSTSPSLEIKDGTPVSDPISSGGNTTPQKSDLDAMIERAFTYVISQQQVKGDFDTPLFTDWTAIAFGKHTLSLSEFNTAKNTLKNYLSTEQPTLSSVTDYERHVLGLSALGISSDEYVTHILDSFDGTQFGINGLDNDDIFAILALCKVDKCNESSVAITAKHIKDDIDADTSGNLYGVDMTSAAVRALLKKYDKTDSAIVKATTYLKSHQNSNASFGDSGLELDSTTWTLDTIGTLGEFSFNGWTKNNNTPFTYLKSVQNPDGSFGTNNKVWSTTYALIGLAYDWSSTAGASNNELENNDQPTTNDNQKTITPTSTPTSTPVVVETPTPTSTPTSSEQIGEGEKIEKKIIENIKIENIKIKEIEEIVTTQVAPVQNRIIVQRQVSNSTDVRGEKIEEERETIESDGVLVEKTTQVGSDEENTKTPVQEENNFPKIPVAVVVVVAGGFGVWRLIKFIV